MSKLWLIVRGDTAIMAVMVVRVKEHTSGLSTMAAFQQRNHIVDI